MKGMAPAPCGSRTFCILCGACRLCDPDQPCYDHDGSETWPHHWKTDAPSADNITDDTKGGS